MSERPTLTVSAPCPTCGGKGWNEDARGIPCTTCKGHKTIRQAVSCGSCKWWNHLEDGWGVCLRTEVDEETQKPIQFDSIAYVWGESIDGQCALMTHATHGCLSWEAKA